MSVYPSEPLPPPNYNDATSNPQGPYNQNKQGPYPSAPPQPVLPEYSQFSKDFETEYAQDYENSGFTDFVPPAALYRQNLNVVVENEGCIPAKEDTGCCYFSRIILSTLTHLGVLVGIFGLIVCAVIENELLLIFGIVLGISFLFMFLESLCAYELRYLRDIRDANSFSIYMSEMHNARPTLSLHVECYHYETRVEHYTDSKGHTRTRTRRKKVVTHVEAEEFAYSVSRELSPPTINLDHHKATRIVFKRTYRFGNDASRQRFQQQSSAIRARNRPRDVHMAYYEMGGGVYLLIKNLPFQRFEIPNFTNRMLAIVDPSSKSPFYNRFLYVLVSFFLCTWPYRWWFKSSTSRTTYTWIKELTI